jgi:hypothetical protein
MNNTQRQKSLWWDPKKSVNYEKFQEKRTAAVCAQDNKYTSMNRGNQLFLDFWYIKTQF